MMAKHPTGCALCSPTWNTISGESNIPSIIDLPVLKLASSRLGGGSGTPGGGGVGGTLSRKEMQSDH